MDLERWRQKATRAVDHTHTFVTPRGSNWDRSRQRDDSPRPRGDIASRGRHTPVDLEQPIGYQENDYVFVLRSKVFTKLLTYVTTGAILPEDMQMFEAQYPRHLLEKHLPRDRYNEMARVLIDIQNHCYHFKTHTMNDADALSRYIAEFAGAAKDYTIVLNESLEIIINPTTATHEANIHIAFTNFSFAIARLVSQARAAKESCEAFHKGLGKFKELTAKDKCNLSRMYTRAKAALPSVHDLEANQRKDADITHGKICSINNQRKSEDKFRSLIEALRRTLQPRILGSGGGEQRALQPYRKVMDDCNTQIQLASQLRTATRQLTRVFEKVAKTIHSAELALETMIGAFADLLVDLDSIKNDLVNADDAIWSNHSWRRQNAATHLNSAGQKWTTVQALAKNFTVASLMREIDFQVLPDFPPEPKILATTWGGVDYTELSKVLFSFAQDLRVLSDQPGFPEPWKDVPKTLSMLYQCGDSMRIFACQEGTGTYVLKGDEFEKMHRRTVEHREVGPVVRVAGSAIEILAVVWAQKVITNPEVHQRLYNAYAKSREPAEWPWRNLGAGTSSGDEDIKYSNWSFGLARDPWPGHRKSGAIYYRYTGGKNIMQICGKEGDKVQFP